MQIKFKVELTYNDKHSDDIQTIRKQLIQMIAMADDWAVVETAIRSSKDSTEFK